jgi:putative phosphoesterase
MTAGSSKGYPDERVGLISDTHGHLRPEVFDALAGVERVIHAGDVEDATHLTDLEAIAPVTAVSGNVDGHAVRAVAPEEAEIDVAGVRVALIHGHQVHPDYRLLLARFPDARVIVHGHTHVPRCDRVGDVLIVNPGAAGMAQKGYAPSVAILEVEEGVATVRHVELETPDQL